MTSFSILRALMALVPAIDGIPYSHSSSSVPNSLAERWYALAVAGNIGGVGLTVSLRVVWSPGT
jgi:hypothetical protein